MLDRFHKLKILFSGEVAHLKTLFTHVQIKKKTQAKQTNRRQLFLVDKTGKIYLKPFLFLSEIHLDIFIKLATVLKVCKGKGLMLNVRPNLVILF